MREISDKCHCRSLKWGDVTESKWAPTFDIEVE